MNIRIVALGLMLIVPGLGAMDREGKQEKHETKKTQENIPRQKPTSKSIWAAIQAGNTIEVARWLDINPRFANAQIARNPDDSDMPAPGAHRLDVHGLTPLWFCIWYKKPDIAELLLRRKADSSQKSLHELTPLQLAAMYDSPEVAEMLLKNKADIDDSNQSGTALCLAAINRKVAMLTLLLSHGANVNKADTDNETPLINAAYSKLPNGNYEECVKKLLLAGADWQHKNAWGETALDVAGTAPIKALLTTDPDRGIPTFLVATMMRAQMPTANRKLNFAKQLQLRESGKLKYKKLSIRSAAIASEGPAQALTTLPNATSINPVVKKLEPKQPLGHMAPQIKTYVSERNPLSFTINANNNDMVRLLLDSKANVHIQTINTSNALTTETERYIVQSSSANRP